MRRNILLAGVLSVGVVTLLLAQTAQPPRTDQDRKQPMRTGEMDKNKDAKFLSEQYQCGLFEIALSREAQTRADRQDVKDYAKTMIDDHTRMNQQIKDLAQKKNMQISMEMADWQQAKLNHVKQLPADEFTHCYSYGQVGAHHIAILANRCATNHAMDTDVKSLAQKTVPELQKHLQQADRIAETLVTAGTVGKMTEGKEGE